MIQHIFIFMRSGSYLLSMFNSSLNRKRAIGILFAVIILTVFLVFNRFPKLDTIQEDLEIVNAPQVECFQGFCIENPDDVPFLTRWWNFSLTYLRLVSIGMIFAFLMAGLTESLLFPPGTSNLNPTRGIWRGTVKGALLGPIWNLCSACVVPVASAFQKKVGTGGAISMVQGSSTLNIPSLVMVILVFSPLLGGSRIVLSVLAALIIGPLVALASGIKKELPEEPDNLIIVTDEMITWKSAFISGFRDWIKVSFRYLLRLGPIMIGAGFLSGLVIQWISPGIVDRYLGDNLTGVAIAATIGILINVPLMFEIPLVFLLLVFGMGIAPAATLLFAAAAGGPITFWGMSKVIPIRGITTYALGTWVIGILGGLTLLGISFISDEINNESGAVLMNVASASNIVTQDIVRDSDIWIAPVISTDLNNQFDPVTPFVNVASDNLINKSEYWNNYVWNYRPGVVIFDYDRDGDQDIFISSETGHSNFLYQNQGNAVFIDVAEQSGVSSPISYATGAVACDINNDGYQDLYVGSQGMTGTRLDFRSSLVDTVEAAKLRESIMDRLFVNNGNGTFSEITQSAFGEQVNYRAATSVACADVDNDGWLDLYVANLIAEDFFVFDDPTHPGHYNILYHNNGNLTFDNIASSAGVDGPQILMRDQQGRVVMFEDPETGDMYEGYDPNSLDADGNRIGDPTGRTHGVMFFDYDDDGDQDLWVANDGDRFHVFRNDSNKLNGEIRFVSVARSMGIDKVGNWMGLTVGDYDGDADLDVFVTNVGYHTRTRPPLQSPAGYCEYHDQFVWGTCLHYLLRNDGTREVSNIGIVGDFKDVAASTHVLPSQYMPPDSLEPTNIGPWWEVSTGIAAYDFGYGVTFFDLENDGDQDLYWTGSEVSSGQGVGGNIYPSVGRMMRNNGEGSFEDITVEAHLLNVLGVDYSFIGSHDTDIQMKLRELRVGFHENGKGVAHGDFNGDGAVDLIVTNSSGRIKIDNSSSDMVYARGPVFLWLNGGSENHWISLRLIGRMAIDGTGSNADAIGSRVYISTKIGNRDKLLVQVQEVRAGSSYLSMDSIELEFGVGSASIIDEIIVLWPSGRRQVMKDIAVDKMMKIIEPKE